MQTDIWLFLQLCTIYELILFVSLLRKIVTLKPLEMNFDIFPAEYKNQRSKAETPAYFSCDRDRDELFPKKRYIVDGFENLTNKRKSLLSDFEAEIEITSADVTPCKHSSCWSDDSVSLHQQLTVQYYLEAHKQEVNEFREQDQLYMGRLNFIRPHSRYVLVEWLFSVHHLLELPRFCLNRVVSVVDLFLKLNCNRTTPLRQLQLIGVASLFVSIYEIDLVACILL